MHSSSHNVPNGVILEWRLGNISECFAGLDKFCSEIWAYCMNTIMYELGSFALVGFSDGSLVWTIFFREYR